MEGINPNKGQVSAGEEMFSNVLKSKYSPYVLAGTALVIAGTIYALKPSYSTSKVKEPTQISQSLPLEQRFNNLESRMNNAEKATGKPLYTIKIHINSDDYIDEMELRDNSTAIAYITNLNGKKSDVINFSTPSLNDFLSRYRNGNVTPRSKEEAQKLYQLGVDSGLIAENNAQKYSDLIKYSGKNSK